ncbi:class I SAM-dependent methyltransferase [Xanthobacter autotrophicus]|uniref:class I SAM-dependent methyltransferase n=1 Tax=Xanthobacter autotrophicus TaxID=280 RepID=UPI00372709B3
MSVEACRSILPAVTFAFPEDLRPSAWTEHVPFAFWLIPVLNPRTVVELGTYRGMSFLAFCQSVVASGTRTRAYAVDSWEGDAHAGTLPPEIYADVKAIVDLKYSSFATLLRMDFDEATTHVADGSVDLLHIDGFHTYEAVSHDFETWRGKLSPDAVVLFHDTQVFERGFGVNRFWNEVRTLGGSFEFHHGHGLGVLAFGAARERLATLMEASEADVTYLRALFARLGRGLTDCQGRLEAQQRQLEAEAEIARLSSSKDYQLGHKIRGLMSGRFRG